MKKTGNIWAYLTTVMKQCERPKKGITQMLMVVFTVPGNVTLDKFFVIPSATICG
jgi:hypothetical protein